jgi:chromosome segregation ATPase
MLSKFLSSIRHDYSCAQIAATEERISTLEEYISECKTRMRDLDREIDMYEDQLLKTMEKRLDLIELMDATDNAPIPKTTQKLA